MNPRQFDRLQISHQVELIEAELEKSQNCCKGLLGDPRSKASVTAIASMVLANIRTCRVHLEKVSEKREGVGKPN